MKFNKLLLASYPRSGSVFLQYCLQYCFKTYRINQTPHLEVFSDQLEYFELVNNVQMIKHHYHEKVKSFDVEDVFNIFVIRDFKECIPSHCKQQGNRDFIANIDRYCKEIVAFNDWENTKQCVYYEDFIVNPIEQISLLVNQINTAYVDTLPNLEKDIDNISKESIKLKRKLGSPSLSGGNLASYHQSSLTDEELNLIIDGVRENLKGSPSFQILARYFGN